MPANNTLITNKLKDLLPRFPILLIVALNTNK